MKAFEVILEGFDGSTDKTDHLVKWVQAELIEHVKAMLSCLNSPVREINEIDMRDHKLFDLIVSPSFFERDGRLQLALTVSSKDIEAISELIADNWDTSGILEHIVTLYNDRRVKDDGRGGLEEVKCQGK